MNIATNVLDVLSNAVINENALQLTGQLDRPLYVATNKVLELAGGKWNKKAKAHLFDGDAAEIMDQIVLTGKITDKKQELGYFPTPKKVVERMLELAEIEPGMYVLEPSAGQGAIIEELVKLDVKVEGFELDRSNFEALIRKHHLARVPIAYGDFLNFLPLPGVEDEFVDRVVMNPPFSKQQDIKHVLHAFKFLRPGGRLVSVMSAGTEFRTNKLTTDFRDFVKAHNGSIEKLPEGSFKDSGTDINTVIVTLEASNGR